MTGGPPPDSVCFTRRGALAGARRTFPLAVSVAAYGTVFGVLARRADLSLVESTLMSGLVYAGASQFVAVELWASGATALALILTTLLVNLRHLLMGASLRGWFGRLPAPPAYGSLFFLNDESWALTQAEYDRGLRDAAFLAGSGLTLWGAWVGATGVGHAAGAAVGDPTALGLDFAFAAVFAALLAGMFKGRADLLPWLTGAAVAIAAEWLLPGNWYVLLGGVAGCLVGAIRDGR
jgi:4-azaleucine resistance transporter AzlC